MDSNSRVFSIFLILKQHQLFMKDRVIDVNKEQRERCLVFYKMTSITGDYLLGRIKINQSWSYNTQIFHTWQIDYYVLLRVTITCLLFLHMELLSVYLQVDFFTPVWSQVSYEIIYLNIEMAYLGIFTIFLFPFWQCSLNLRCGGVL